jgi:hypothetical protein
VGRQYLFLSTFRNFPGNFTDFSADGDGSEKIRAETATKGEFFGFFIPSHIFSHIYSEKNTRGVFQCMYLGIICRTKKMSQKIENIFAAESQYKDRRSIPNFTESSHTIQERQASFSSAIVDIIRTPSISITSESSPFISSPSLAKSPKGPIYNAGSVSPATPITPASMRTLLGNEGKNYGSLGNSSPSPR